MDHNNETSASQLVEESHKNKRLTKAISPKVRLYRCLDLLLPAAIIGFIINGWYWSFIEIGIRFLIQRNGKTWFGLLYITTTGALFGAVTTLFLYVVSTRVRNRPMQIYELPEVSLLTEPYECTNSDGGLRLCLKNDGPCRKQWKPPRTHHCSTCGVCRPGFDHHCPWLGTCITSSLMPAFLLILTITPALIFLAVFPILPVMKARAFRSLEVSRETAWIQRQWWDRWYSWIFFGGPAGRWVVGTFLGARALQSTEQQLSDRDVPGSLIVRPGVGLLVTVALAILLGTFTGAMALATIRDITLGLSSVESRVGERRPSTKGGPISQFLCIPAMARSGETKVYEIRPEERLYDLGWRENWRKFFLQVKRNGLFGDNDERFTWPKINPIVLRRCRDSDLTQELSDPLS